MASSTDAVPVPSSKPVIIDDKSPICIPFILARLKIHQSQHANSPFFIGLNGVQGAGKTTLVEMLARTLTEEEGLQTLVCSIDDLYLRHEDQVALAEEQRENALVQHRGEPGTHDMQLAKQLFEALKQGKETKIPQYDKSAYNGQGDRVASSKWESVNGTGQPKAQVIIFEGWCVGFRALSEAEVGQKQKSAESSISKTSSTLPKHKLEHLLFVNEMLRGYDIMTDCLDAFIHVDAEKTAYVYDWRLQQEAALRKDKGMGMTDEQVVRFVDGYYPAYELFTDRLREGIFGSGEHGRQLRLIVGKDRRVRRVIEI